MPPPAPRRSPQATKPPLASALSTCKDTDGHNFEIIYFPPGKGDPRWQRKDGTIILGHRSYRDRGIEYADNSLKFYRDLLGLKLVGESMNSGTEQEHLNNVAGARLRISGLRGQRRGQELNSRISNPA